MRVKKRLDTVLGFSSDKRKRRREHRRAARNLLTNGGVFNNFSEKGSTFNAVAVWHLNNARYRLGDGRLTAVRRQASSAKRGIDRSVRCDNGE